MVYPLYESSWGFTAATSTLVFAMYPLVLIPVLLVFGNVSDHLGRRFAILLGLAALALGTLVFGVAAGLPAVLLGRALMGVGVGLSLSPAAAAMLEVGGPRRARHASSVLTASTAAGLALATLVGGALVEYAPAPLHLPFWVLLAVIVVVGGCALLLPRGRDPLAGAWRPRLPRVPSGLRRTFIAGALAIACAYAVGSVFLALGAQVALELLRSANAFVDGAVLSISAVAIGVVAIAARSLAPRAALALGPVAILLGMGCLVVAGVDRSMPLFVIASIVTGAGYSLMYAGGVGIITAAAPAHHRAAIISAAFTVGYLVQACVALALGAIATAVGLLTAMEVGGLVLVALAGAAALVANLRVGRRAETDDALLLIPPRKDTP